MDCIPCDKCRLNGKVQVRGLATILKVLFLPDSRKLEIMKAFSSQEVVSTVQLLIRLSESLNILELNRLNELKHEQRLIAAKQAISLILALIGAVPICSMALGSTEKKKEKA